MRVELKTRIGSKNIQGNQTLEATRTKNFNDRKLKMQYLLFNQLTNDNHIRIVTAVTRHTVQNLHFILQQN